MISVAQKLWLNYVIALESLMLATNLSLQVLFYYPTEYGFWHFFFI